MEQNNKKCGTCDKQSNKNEDASSCSKLHENNKSKIPIYIYRCYSETPRTATQSGTSIPKDKVTPCCGHSTKNTDVKQNVSEKISSKAIVCCSKKDSKKSKEISSTSTCQTNKSKQATSRVSICCSQGSVSKQSKKLQLESSSKSQKSITDNKCCSSKPEIKESVFQIGQFKVKCNKSTLHYETSKVKETEHITTVSIDTNELSKKNPSCCIKPSKSSKTVFCTSKSNVDSNNEKRIVLPEVKIDVGSQKLQTIQIDVRPTDLKTKSSGIITLPVQLRFKKVSPRPTDIPCCNKFCNIIPPIPDYQKKHTLVYEACDKNEYFQEMYMDELAEEELKKVKVKFPEEIVEKYAIVQEPDTPEFLTVEEDISEPEITEVQEIPWYQIMENDKYVEPYLQEGYCITGDNVEVQTDLVLGCKLLSESINSVPDISLPHGRSSSKFICRCGTASELIDWQIVFLKPVNTITVKSENEEEITKTALFSEPPDSNPPDTEPIETESIQIPEKYKFVYKSNRESYEPYLQNLLKQFPDKPIEPENENVQVQLPWKTIELPNKIQIRKIQKFIFTKKLPVSCISAPCMYGGVAKSTTNCKCGAEAVSLSNLNALFEYTSSEQSLLNSLPCQNRRKPILKSTVANGIKYKAFIEKSKNKGFCAKVTYNLPQGTSANTFTKVTFKNNKNLGNKITPKSSRSVTYEYLNTNMNQDMEESKTDILCNLCENSRCDYREKTPAICNCKPTPKPSKLELKPDPVIAAFQACEAELKPVREALMQVQRKLKNLHMPELDSMFKKESNEFLNEPLFSFKCPCPPCGCQFNSVQRSKKSTCECQSTNMTRTTSCNKRNKAIQKTGSQYKNLDFKKPKCSEKCVQIKNSRRNKSIQKSGSHSNKGNLYKECFQPRPCDKKLNSEYNSSNKRKYSSSQDTVFYSTSSSPSTNHCSNSTTCISLKRKRTYDST